MGKRNFKHITIYERMDIQAYIKQGYSIRQIAKKMHRNPSSISREIKGKNNKVTMCELLRKIPSCNSCPNKDKCSKEKLYYDFSKAQERSEENKTLSRSKSFLSEMQIEKINNIVSPLIFRGQSLHHIYCSNSELKNICSERTIRRLVNRRELDAKSPDLRRFVRFKHKKPKAIRKDLMKDPTILINRNYSNFLDYIERHKSCSIVEYDSVIGKITDQRAILTITLRKYRFQFGLLVSKSNPTATVLVLIKLFARIGKIRKKIFEANLCDNGIEFSTFYQIESFVGRTFYTNPYQSNNKAVCERNHEFIRYCIPKGKTLDNLTQEMLNEMFSNINSYVRKSLGDKTPYDLVKRRFGQNFLDAIGIKRIPNKKVKLIPIA